MDKYDLEEKVIFYAKTINVEIGKEVNVVVKLFDDSFNPKKDSKNQTALAVKEYKEKVLRDSGLNGKIEKDISTIKSFAQSLGVEPEKVKYISGWIDANDDGEITREYEEEVVLEVGSCCLTMEKFEQIFPTAPESKRKEVYEVFKKYCQVFEINTCLRIAHFFAQVKEEVGNSLVGNEESLWYSISALKSMFTRYFKHFPTEAEQLGYKRISRQNYKSLKDIDKSKYIKHGNYYYSQFPQEDEIAKRVYCCDGKANYFNDCKIQGGCDDGILYKGKGFIQLTWKNNYKAVNDILNNKVPNENIDILTNPNSVLETRIGMLSAMGFWEWKKLNKKADVGSVKEVVDSITAVVNKNTSSYAEREKHFTQIYNILKG